MSKRFHDPADWIAYAHELEERFLDIIDSFWCLNGKNNTNLLDAFKAAAVTIAGYDAYAIAEEIFPDAPELFIYDVVRMTKFPHSQKESVRKTIKKFAASNRGQSYKAMQALIKENESAQV